MQEKLLSRRLEWDDAAALQGEAFEFFPLEDASRPVALSVTDVKLRSRDARGVQFSIVFRGPAAPVYPQRIYRFRHARLGEYAIFVTAIAQGVGGVDYEAVFSYGG